MAAIFMAEKSFTPYKQLKSIPKRNMGANLVSKPNENLAPTNTINGGAGVGLFFAPPQSLSFSYPPPAASHLNPIFYPNHRQQQPLLPLPSTTHNKPPHNSLPSRTQSLSSSSSSPSNRKNNRTRDQSLTPKRSKSRPCITGKVLEDQSNKNQYLKPTEATKKQAAISESTVSPLGPDPNDLLKVSKPNENIATATEKFSGSVFTLSPPPSSLPLPKFSLKPKLISCNVEAAAGVDVGATDNLRRLLRLH